MNFVSNLHPYDPFMCVVAAELLEDLGYIVVNWTYMTFELTDKARTSLDIFGGLLADAV